jgi:hypothetical protein
MADATATTPADTAPEAGPSSKVAQAVMDAPVNAMFAPARTKAEIKKRKRMKHPIPEPYSTGEVLWLDVRSFLGEEWVDGVIAKGDEGEWEVPQELRDGQELTLRVGAFTVSGGSSLGEDMVSRADVRRVVIAVSTFRQRQEVGDRRSVCTPWRPHQSQGAEARSVALDRGPCGDIRIRRDASRRSGRQAQVPGGRVQVLWRLVSW